MKTKHRSEIVSDESSFCWFDTERCCPTVDIVDGKRRGIGQIVVVEHMTLQQRLFRRSVLRPWLTFDTNRIVRMFSSARQGERLLKSKRKELNDALSDSTLAYARLSSIATGQMVVMLTGGIDGDTGTLEGWITTFGTELLSHLTSDTRDTGMKRGSVRHRSYPGQARHFNT